MIKEWPPVKQRTGKDVNSTQILNCRFDERPRDLNGSRRWQGPHCLMRPLGVNLAAIIGDLLNPIIIG